jgi:hypothetical protein
MASSAFSRIAAAVDVTKNLETILPGAPSLDDSAPHDVTILAVDTSKLESDNKLEVIFGDAKGNQHRDSMFVASQDEAEGYSYNFRWLLAGCIPDQAALEMFYKVAATNVQVLECFTGMKMRITLQWGPGIRVHATSKGTYVGLDSAVVDPSTDLPIPQTAEYAQLADVYKAIKADASKKRSYLRIQRIEATNKPENLAAFATAVAALTSAS